MNSAEVSLLTSLISAVIPLVFKAIESARQGGDPMAFLATEHVMDIVGTELQSQIALQAAEVADAARAGSP